MSGKCSSTRLQIRREFRPIRNSMMSCSGTPGVADQRLHGAPHNIRMSARTLTAALCTLAGFSESQVKPVTWLELREFGRKAKVL